MPIPVKCDCGKSLKVKDELAGRRIRCPGCQEAVRVPMPEAPKAEEEEALDILLEEEPEPARPKRRPVPEDDDERITAKTPPPRPKPAPAKKKRVDPPKYKRQRSERIGSRDRYRTSGLVVNSSIISGLLMMGGAVLWFVVGLYAGWIFYYPPILFILGVASVIRGFTGQED